MGTVNGKVVVEAVGTGGTAQGENQGGQAGEAEGQKAQLSSKQKKKRGTQGTNSWWKKSREAMI